MIEVEEAIARIKKTVKTLGSKCVDLSFAQGCFLAEDITAQMAVPFFSQSAMDGYAICGINLPSYTVVGEIKAGDNHSFALQQGEAYRIFTGAMIPANTDAIAKQEIVTKQGTTITINETVQHGTSIRKKGEELKIGDVVLTKGTYINAAAIGLLSNLGIQKINIFTPPNITLVVTGNELTQPGQKLTPGKIFDSNSFMLKAALNAINITPKIVFTEDSYAATKKNIQTALNTSDLTIITGGISVGDYDFVEQSLTDLKVTEVFYKIKQKPGKPIYFGKKGNVLVFALPGNPAAALTCFYMYVLTSINIIKGNKTPFLAQKTATINHDYTKKNDRAYFLKAQLNKNNVSIHSGQSSAMLSSFVNANCLLFLDTKKSKIYKGDKVTVYLINS